MKRIRSPSYPAISLPDAIERVRRLVEKRGPEPGTLTREEVLQGFGFTGTYGPSYLKLAAAKKFGLIIGKEASGYSVSKRAMAILKPDSPAQRQKALQSALHSPRLYAELADLFPDEVSDENLAEFLRLARFSENAVSRVIASFRASVEFVRNCTDARPSENSSPAGEAMSPDPFRVTFTGDQIEISGVLETVDQVERLKTALDSAKVLLRR